MFERNEQEISQIIEENLESFLSGNVSIEQLSRRYPRQAAELRRELETAAWLHSRRDEVKSRPGFIKASRGRVITRVKKEMLGEGKEHSFLSFSWLFQRRFAQWAGVLVILLLLLTSAGGVVVFAQNALPGQQLYAIKRSSENIALGLTFSPIKKVELSVEFTDRRFQEAEALVYESNLVYVEATLEEFNAGVNQSVSLLEKVDNSMPAEKLVLAERLTKNLETKADRLSVLAKNAPAEIQADISISRAVTLSGASSMTVVVNEMNEILGTSTPTGTTTPVKSTSTPTPTVTWTLTPGVTLQNAQEKDIGKPETTHTPPGLENKKPTNTPRPTNPNRPTDSGEKPTKEPKPDKPTKDKSDKDK